jgi:metal-sulfur cluster biosynthetic enzyme
MSDRVAEQAGATGGSTHGAMGAVTPGAAGVESPGATDAPEGLPAFVNVRPGTGSLWAALREVLDPEFPISVVDLGLVYDIRRDAGRVEVDVTFTAMACPCMDFIKDDVRERLEREPGVDEVVVQVVWDPPWTRERLSERAREELRRFGVAA